jgi:hypothetical protein
MAHKSFMHPLLSVVSAWFWGLLCLAPVCSFCCSAGWVCRALLLAGFLVFVSQFWGCRFVVFWLCWFSALPQFCVGGDCVCFVRFCVCCRPCCAGCFYSLYCIVLLFLLACTCCSCGGIVNEFFGRLK